MREDVPYPGGCDSAALKCWKEWIEKIVEEKMSTLNGVSGDASGNVQIVGSSGVGVNTDDGNHQIQIDVSEASVKSASSAVDAEYAESTRGTGNLVTTDTEQSISGKKTIGTLKTSAHAALSADDVACYGDLSDVAGPNNLVHKSGVEKIGGAKYFTSRPTIKMSLSDRGYYQVQSAHSKESTPDYTNRSGIRIIDSDSNDLMELQILEYTDGSFALQMRGYPMVNGVRTLKSYTILRFNTDGTIKFGE